MVHFTGETAKEKKSPFSFQMFQKLRLTKCRLEDVAQVASVIAGHASLLPLVLEQMLLEVARVAVGRVTDVTLVRGARAVSRL